MLDGREAVDAALGVAAYLRRRASPPSRQLFSLRDPSGRGTFDFALQFASADATLPALQAAEAADAEARVQAHWAEVKRKQALAAELRSKLVSLRAELANQEARASEALQRIQSTLSYGRCDAAGHRWKPCKAFKPSARPSLLTSPLPHLTPPSFSSAL